MATDASRQMARQRLKRKQKQAEQRRAKSVSVYKRIEQSGQLVECCFNPDWAERGQATIFVLRRVPGGGLAMAVFLVDLWCAGLKDVWVRLDLTREIFEQHVRMMGEELPMASGDPETARRIVAGGVRFAVQNGFRLPPRYERAAAFLGGVKDWASADLNRFGIEGGKLCWVGPMWDLRNRLIGSSVEAFLAREDVEYTIELDEDNLDEFGEVDEEQWPHRDDAETAPFRRAQEAADYIERGLADFQQKLLNEAKRWCFANGQAPHPRLEELLGVVWEASVQGDEFREEPAGESSPDEQALKRASNRIDQLIGMEDPDTREELREAQLQFSGFLQGCGDLRSFMERLGILPE